MRLIYILMITAIIGIFSGCSEENVEPIADHELATAWADMTLYITQHTGSNSPTYASRCLGYIGLTMYESIVHGYDSHQSIAPHLNELPALPQPDPSLDYHWPSALNAGQASILKSIYNQTSDANKLKIDSLADALQPRISMDVSDRATIQRSKEYGTAVANAIFEWSKTDGGHRGYLKNFDKEWVHPEFPGSWKPPLFAQSFSHHPLHPHWGKNRTLLKENSDLEIPKMLPYSTDPESEYYQQFLTVYEKDKVLSQSEKEAAIWWGDDPDESFTPPGHSYYITTAAIRAHEPDLIHCAETYARVGLAVADAFTNCWKWKYYNFSERANTFIPQHIDQEFESFWPDPPFPAFPSGHAINGGASAGILIELYGDSISFVDSSHVGRERDHVREVDFVAREFSSFSQIAREIADSRFYGGIHIPYDNEVGLREGQRIADHVNQLPWRKK